MEAVAAIIAIFLLLTGACAALFMVSFQPFWAIIDVAVSKEHSSGTKAAVILLTLLLLGPIMSFLYACFGTRSNALKRTSIIAAFVMMISASAFFILAITYPPARSNVSRLLHRDSASGPTSQMETLPDDRIDMPAFTAVHYVPTADGRWSVAIADFDIHGPVANSAQPVNVPSIYPLNQIAIDPEGHRIYGATTHLIGRIVPATGNFVELEIDPALPRLSWPSGIAFDTHNRRLVVTGRSGTYFLDPDTGEWRYTPKFGGMDLLSMAYDEDNRVFYGLVSGFGKDVVDTIVRINPDGAVLSTIALSEGIPSETLPAGRAQLIKTPRDLVILVSAYRSRRGAEDTLAESRMYMVDPNTGDIGLVRAVSSN